MLHHLFEIIRVDGIQDIKEVLSRWSFVFWKYIQEIQSEPLIFCKLMQDILHGKLIVVRHFNMSYSLLLQQLFFFRENLLKKVLVYRLSWWQVILNYKGIRQILKGYLRCLSKYWMKSTLDLSFHESSDACKKPSDLFLLSWIWDPSIL